MSELTLVKEHTILASDISERVQVRGIKWIDHPGIQLAKKDLYQECWRLSCQNILKDWRKICL